MAVRYQKIVSEDLDLGTGTTDVDMPGGGTQVGHQIGPHSFGALAFAANMDGGQSVTGGAAAAAIQLDTREYDVADWYSASTYKFAPTVDGYYHIDGYASLAAFTGTATLSIYKNGVLVVSAEAVRTATAAKWTVSADVALDSGDYVQLMIAHNDGSSNRSLTAARINGHILGKV